MNKIRLLVVDDLETNRMVLMSICRVLKNFEMREAENGFEAIDIVEQWRPHIILMDIMMPKLDGFQTSKIIRERYPDIMIIAVTAVTDPNMEKNMAAIGVVTYIHKPIDKDLIRFKLQNFGALVQSKEGKFKLLANSNSLNAFSSDIRRLKTVFDIDDSDAMMDFGMWILIKVPVTCFKIDIALELFYALMSQITSSEESMTIVVEENFDEIFVTIECEEGLEFQPKILSLAQRLGDMCLIKNNHVYVRLPLQENILTALPPSPAKMPEPTVVAETIEPLEEPKVAVSEPPSTKEIHVVGREAKEMLRQSFTNKTSPFFPAVPYCIDLIEGPYLECNEEVIKPFRPKQ